VGLPCSASLHSKRGRGWGAVISPCSLPLAPLSPGPRVPLFGQAEILELQDVQSQVLQETLKRLDKAFKFMKERGFGFPRFKRVWAIPLVKWLQRQLKIKSKALTTTVGAASALQVARYIRTLAENFTFKPPSVVRSSQDAFAEDLNFHRPGRGMLVNIALMPRGVLPDILKWVA